MTTINRNDEYVKIYEDHLDGIPPVFNSLKQKSKYYKWIKNKNLHIPTNSAKKYIEIILKKLNIEVPEEIEIKIKSTNPLVTTAVWLYQNTNLTQEEIKKVTGISTTTIRNYYKKN